MDQNSEVGPAPKRAILHFWSADWHKFGPTGTFHSWVPGLRLSFGPIWTPFLRIFEPRIVPSLIFNLYSKN